MEPNCKVNIHDLCVKILKMIMQTDEYDSCTNNWLVTVRFSLDVHYDFIRDDDVKLIISS